MCCWGLQLLNILLRCKKAVCLCYILHLNPALVTEFSQTYI